MSGSRPDALMHLTQCVNSQASQKPGAQPGPSNRRRTNKSWQINDQHRQRAKGSPQNSVSVNTRRNKHYYTTHNTRHPFHAGHVS